MLMNLQRGVEQGIRALYAGWSDSGKMARPICLVLLSLVLEGCARPSVQEPVTLTLLEEWSNKTFSEARQQELQQFTRETGIRVNLLPSPESARQRLVLWQKLLGTGASSPDVYGIDLIWPGMLSEYFVDLKPYFSNEVSRQFPPITAGFTVDNKLVAMAYRADIGLLYYRTDLLRQYGYREPPRTWDELEIMAARIQAGERAKGKKQFWGFVWQGAADEVLTCDALEWQAAEGGGRIIEDDRTISVNNPRTIRAWQRAARWVGSISPPGVVAYEKWDAENFWSSGKAAFHRAWVSDYSLIAFHTPPGNATLSGVTSLPGGSAGRAGTLGGNGLAVSRTSRHTREALELIRFLLRRDARLMRASANSEAPKEPELY